MDIFAVLKHLFFMKYFLFFFMLFCSSVYSQARLGSSRIDIFKEFESDSPTFHSTEDGVQYMSIQLPRAYVSYVFDDYAQCTMCTVIPNNQGDLNYYVESYNSKYVILGSRSWKMYSESGIVALIELQNKDGVSVFVWTIVK
jgi:hypothetical protein